MLRAMSDEPKQSESTEATVDRARRRLLRLGAYVAPAVIGSMLTAQARAQTPSCGPATCNPNGGPCGPANCAPRA